MTLETKKTLSLTKAEKKVLIDFYWNVYDDDTDDIYEVLRALATNTPKYTTYEIEIID
jgi:hypothetical protein